MVLVFALSRTTIKMPLVSVGNRKVTLHVIAVMMATEFCKLSCSSPVLARTGLQRDRGDSEECQAGGGFCVWMYRTHYSTISFPGVDARYAERRWLIKLVSLPGPGAAKLRISFSG